MPRKFMVMTVGVLAAALLTAQGRIRQARLEHGAENGQPCADLRCGAAAGATAGAGQETVYVERGKAPPRPALATQQDHFRSRPSPRLHRSSHPSRQSHFRHSHRYRHQRRDRRCSTPAR